MKKIIVADASPLIALAKLDCLELLFCSFNTVHLPEAVYQEVTVHKHRTDSLRIADFLQKQDGSGCFVHADIDNTEYRAFRDQLDEGESQALSLASKLNCGILIDERLGRNIAAHYSIPVVGVMGILLKAKESGEITQIKPFIDQLLEHKYRLSDRVINIVLQRAGETREE